MLLRRPPAAAPRRRRPPRPPQPICRAPGPSRRRRRAPIAARAAGTCRRAPALSSPRRPPRAHWLRPPGCGEPSARGANLGREVAARRVAEGRERRVALSERGCRRRCRPERLGTRLERRNGPGPRDAGLLFSERNKTDGAVRFACSLGWPRSAAGAPRISATVWV